MTSTKERPTTLGTGLFLDPLVGFSTISEIRQRLETKYCAALAAGKTNGFPLHVKRLRDSKFRAMGACNMIFQDWSVKDLVECTEGLEGHAGTVLMATLEDPIWGKDDFLLMGIIEQLEAMRTRGMRGGRSL